MADADPGGPAGSTETVGRYEILREIGRGGMAIVYVARQPDLDRQVALKELSRFHAGSAEYAHRFLRESRLAGSLNHPNIVTVHEYFEHAGIPYIAMEYVPRGSLRPYMRRLSLSQIAGVLEGVLAGLTYGEAAGIVHRDLKPENIMVTADGRVKITDFGIARATQRAGTQYLTATGMTVGTPTYMAPEQAMAGDIGPWSDLYSVGVLTYELLVGEAPFHDTDSPVAILMRHVNEPIPPAIEMRPEIDPGLSQWIDSLLVKEPSDRVRHALDAWEALEEIIVRMLGPLWRRNARLLDDHVAVVNAQPLTPAPFESHASIQTPTPGATAAVAEEFVTFDPGRAVDAPQSSAPAAPPETAPRAVTPETPEPVAPEPEAEASTAEQSTPQPETFSAEPEALTPETLEPESPAPEPEAFTPEPETSAAKTERPMPELPPESDAQFVTYAPSPAPPGEASLPRTAPEAPAIPPPAPEPPSDREPELQRPTGRDVEPEPEPPLHAPEPASQPPEPIPVPIPDPLIAPDAEPVRARSAAAVGQPHRPPAARTALIGALAVVAVAAAVAGFVLAPSSHGGSPSPVALSQSVPAGSFTIRVPGGWRGSAVTPAQARSLNLTKAVTLEPAGSANGGALVLGTADSVGATLLPSSFTAALSPAPQGAAVNLGPYLFKRYLDLVPHAAATPMSVYSLPTMGGTAIIACVLPQSGATAFAVTCERAVSSLKASGAVLPLTARVAYASALSPIVSTFDQARTSYGRQLAGAKTQRDQASAARALASAYRRAAAAVAKLTPGPIGASANGAIVAALRQLHSGYQSLASAAEHNSATLYAAAQTKITRADAALSTGFAQLSQDGFSIG